MHTRENDDNTIIIVYTGDENVDSGDGCNM